MDKFRHMKHWSFYVAILAIIIFSWFALTLEETERDYTNLTVPSYPDIAIDYCEIINHPEPMKWKLSKKRLTKTREWYYKE